jgi:glutathione S-transferase
MKLYYAPGACSLAPHIVAKEAGINIQLDKLDWATGITESGEVMKDVNVKGGYVPALRLDDGSVFTEVGVLIQMLGDKNPESGLTSQAGTMERYRLMEIINFISTEIHKGFGPLWIATNPQEVKDAAKKQLGKRFDYLETVLSKSPYLQGESFTVADAYLFTVTNWAAMHAVDLTPWPHLVAYRARVQARPKVQEAMKAEGLL